MNIVLTEEQQRIILECYDKGDISYSAIAEMVGAKRQTVKSFVYRKVWRGELPKKELPLKVPQHKKVDKKPHVQPKGTVNCTQAISKTCIYGSYSNGYLCNYCACTGKPRITVSPDPRECSVYERITKDNPRRKEKMKSLTDKVVEE